MKVTMRSRTLIWIFLALSASLVASHAHQVPSSNTQLASAFSEKEKIRQELVKEMAEYLYTAIQRDQQSAGLLDDGSLPASRRPPLFPVSGFDFSVLGPMRQSNPVEPANVRPLDSSDTYDSNVKYFIKKSMTDNKQIRFHQCYFNPISCFRK